MHMLYVYVCTGSDAIDCKVGHARDVYEVPLAVSKVHFSTAPSVVPNSVQ